MARTQPGCVGKFSVVVLILMFTKQKNLNLSAQLLTVLFGRQPIRTTANFFSRVGSDRPYFLTFLARTQASMIMQLMKQRINTMRIFFYSTKCDFYSICNYVLSNTELWQQYYRQSYFHKYTWFTQDSFRSLEFFSQFLSNDYRQGIFKKLVKIMSLPFWQTILKFGGFQLVDSNQLSSQSEVSQHSKKLTKI